METTSKKIAKVSVEPSNFHALIGKNNNNMDNQINEGPKKWKFLQVHSVFIKEGWKVRVDFQKDHCEHHRLSVCTYNSTTVNHIAFGNGDPQAMPQDHVLATGL